MHRRRACRRRGLGGARHRVEPHEPVAVRTELAPAQRRTVSQLERGVDRGEFARPAAEDHAQAAAVAAQRQLGLFPVRRQAGCEVDLVAAQAHAEQVLDRIGLATNKQLLPDDPNPPMRPSGIRIGTPACTTRGMGTAEMQALAPWIVQALRSPNDGVLLERLADEVKALARRFPVPGIA